MPPFSERNLILHTIACACLMECSIFQQQKDSQNGYDKLRISKIKEEPESESEEVEVDVVSLENTERYSISCPQCLDGTSCQTFRKRQRSKRLLSDDVPEPSMKRIRALQPPPLLIPVKEDGYFDSERITPIKPHVRTSPTRCNTEIFYGPDLSCNFLNLVDKSRRPDEERCSAFELFEKRNIKDIRIENLKNSAIVENSEKKINIKEEALPSLDGSISEGSDLAPTRSTSPVDEISAKKLKNKEASKHYREKKKSAIKKVFQEEKILAQQNQQLQEKLKDLERTTEILQKDYASRINSKQRIKEEVCRLIAKSKKPDFSDIAQEVNVLQKVLQQVANDSNASGYVENAIYEIWGEMLKANHKD